MHIAGYKLPPPPRAGANSNRRWPRSLPDQSMHPVEGGRLLEAATSNGPSMTPETRDSLWDCLFIHLIERGCHARPAVCSRRSRNLYLQRSGGLPLATSLSYLIR
ncbi:hypothetical protein EVAR_53947_1 [Eumeta japonica]|uniref:Uncharacterized protein n=1 Tax=Eumeta variegata TaxID=151549 RepID=A0A4C1ZA89_EUMVA|nr:hypothetical protein EVAR_53947_1 [Eumeta japonica]